MNVNVELYDCTNCGMSEGHCTYVAAWFDNYCCEKCTARSSETHDPYLRHLDG